MNTEQKRAWIVLSASSLGCVAFVVLGSLYGFGEAGPTFGLLGLAGFSGLVGRHERRDERDLAIGRRATLAGAMASYGTFIAGCTGTWLVAYAWHRQEQLSVHLLAAITMAGVAVLPIARSVAILILYGRHVEAENA